MKPRILFLCVHNSARSQLAEALLRQRAGETVEAYSAGSEPSTVNPYAIRVLQDRGIDSSGLRSKSVQEFVDQNFDYVITLCNEEVCPYFPGNVTRLHWGMPDPSAVSGDTVEKMEAFERTADELDTRLDELMNALMAQERI